MNFVWITWRQHRLAIVSVAALALLAAAFLVMQYKWMDKHEYGYYGWHILFGWTPYAPTIFCALIAAFWAAPMLSREYENRTHLLAWSQDVSPKRWLIGKAAVLAVAAVVVMTVVALATRHMFSGTYGRPFSIEVFDSNLFVVVAHTLFGIALGLAFSALFRQTLLAVGATVTVFFATRVFSAAIVRPYYLPPVQTFKPWEVRPAGEPPTRQVPTDGYRIDSGYADAAGNPMEVPEACRFSGYSYDTCVKENGVAGHYAIFQPPERIPVFQLIEVAIFLVLAAALFLFTLKRIQRRQRI